MQDMTSCFPCIQMHWGDQNTSCIVFYRLHAISKSPLHFSTHASPVCDMVSTLHHGSAAQICWCRHQPVRTPCPESEGRVQRGGHTLLDAQSGDVPLARHSWRRAKSFEHLEGSLGWKSFKVCNNGPRSRKKRATVTRPDLRTWWMASGRSSSPVLGGNNNCRSWNVHFQRG